MMHPYNHARSGITSMYEMPSFARLLETAGLIVRHADYPGKRQVVERCRQEVEEFARSGRITATEGETLHEILLNHKHQTA
jgi:hypothetical protein